MPKLTRTLIDEHLRDIGEVNVAYKEHTGDEADPYYIWDAQVPGFGVKVFPSGKVTFVLKYRTNEGGRSAQQRWFKIGQYGSITIDEARKQVAILNAEIVGGHDPQRLRIELRDATTMKILWERFEREHLPKRKTKTGDDYRAMWKNHIQPEFGTSKIKDISRKEIIALHLRVSKKSPYTANRLVAMLSKLFNMAEKWELRADGVNPCRHVERNPENKRERYLGSEEIAALGKALRDGLALQEENHYMAAAIQLLLLTGARVSEILGTRWEWVDLDRRVINLPDSKTGAKQLFLSEPAVVVIRGLSELPRSKGQPFVIRGRSIAKPFDNLRKVWRRVSKRAGISGARLHDLRHTAASIGVNGGLTLPIIGKLLGHTQVSTTQRYAHVNIDPSLAAIDAIGQTVTASLGTTPIPRPGEAIGDTPNDSLAEAAE